MEAENNLLYRYLPGGITPAHLEHLADLYERAGRSRDDAYLYGAQFYVAKRVEVGELQEFLSHVRAMEKLAEGVTPVNEGFVIQCATAIAAGDFDIMRELNHALRVDDRSLLMSGLEKVRDVVLAKAFDSNEVITDVSSFTVIVAKMLIVDRYVEIQVGKIFAEYVRSECRQVLPEMFLWNMGMQPGMTKETLSQVARKDVGHSCSDADIYDWMKEKLRAIASESIESVGSLINVSNE